MAVSSHPLLIFTVCALALVASVALISRLLRHRSPRSSEPARFAEPAPAGVVRQHVVRHAAVPFFRLIAISVLFQAVLVFLFAWAAPFREHLQARAPGLLALLLFVLTVSTGFIWAWRKGGLDWDPQHSAGDGDGARG